MNIGIDIRILQANYSGIPNYIRNILNNLQILDKKNTYFLFGSSRIEFKIHNPNWKIVHVDSFLPVIIHTQLVFPFLLLKYKIDVYCAFDFICPLLAPKKTKRFTVVYDLTYVNFPKTMEWKRLIASRLLVYASMLVSDKVVTISDYIKREIQYRYPKVGKSKIFIASVAVPSWNPPESYKAENRRSNLLFIGNFEPRKNILNLIKALEKIEDETITLHIIGNKGWKNEDLCNHIKSNKAISNRILFKGFLSEEELKLEYLQCKAFVYPSVYEGFGIPILEALSLDCLVLTSQGTVMQEVAQDAALYFDPYKPSSIAETISLIYKKDFDRNIYLKKRGDVLRKYSWVESSKIFLNEFSKIQKI